LVSGCRVNLLPSAIFARHIYATPLSAQQLALISAAAVTTRYEGSANVLTTTKSTSEGYGGGPSWENLGKHHSLSPLQEGPFYPCCYPFCGIAPPLVKKSQQGNKPARTRLSCQSDGELFN